ncbi:MAG: YaiO family outer membrane beta-barrel protein [Bryobacteraceae bacterium]
MSLSEIVSGELYQSLPEGFEVSGGFRRLGFASPLNVYTGSFSKYYHSWLIGARTYVTPASTGGARDAGLSRSAGCTAWRIELISMAFTTSRPTARSTSASN